MFASDVLRFRIVCHMVFVMCVIHSLLFKVVVRCSNKFRNLRSLHRFVYIVVSDGGEKIVHRTVEVLQILLMGLSMS